MKAFALASLTFIGVFIVAALIRGITKEMAGPGLVSFSVAMGTVLALFYFPYKVFKNNKEIKNDE